MGGRAAGLGSARVVPKSTTAGGSIMTLEDTRRAEYGRTGRELPCRTHDPDLFFAETNTQAERAKQLCRGCPARDVCFAGALSRREPWGVWGGELFIDGVVVAYKRGRGRPPRAARTENTAA